MADYEATGEELEKLVRLGKKRPMPFAFCPANGDDEALFATHRKKPPEMIAKSARKASGQTKVAFGFFTVEAKTMILVLHKELPQIAKRLKKHLKRERLWLNIRVLDQMGNELEADIEPVPEDQIEPEAPADAPADADLDTITEDDADQSGFDQNDDMAPDDMADGGDFSDDGDAPDAALLTRHLKNLEPQISVLQGEARTRLGQALLGAVALLKAGELARADSAITAIARAVARQQAEGASAPDHSAPDRSMPEALVRSPEVVALSGRLVGLQPRLAVLPEAARGKVQAAVALVVGQIKAGNVAQAASALQKIEAALAPDRPAPRPADSAAPQPDAADDGAAQWAKTEAKLKPAVFAALASGKGDGSAIRKGFAGLQEQADAGRPEVALARVSDLARLLRAAQTAPKAAVPADIALFVKSRQVWSSTRSLLQSEIGRLKAAIDTVLADIPGMADTAGQTGKLFSRLTRLDGRLEETLEQLAILPDGPKREQLKDRARTVIAQYRGELDDAFFTAIDGGNGFVPVRVRGPAITALARVSDVLA